MLVKYVYVNIKWSILTYQKMFSLFSFCNSTPSLLTLVQLIITQVADWSQRGVCNMQCHVKLRLRGNRNNSIFLKNRTMGETTDLLWYQTDSKYRNPSLSPYISIPTFCSNMILNTRVKAEFGVMLRELAETEWSFRQRGKWNTGEGSMDGCQGVMGNDSV